MGPPRMGGSFHVTCEHTTLDSGTHSYNLVRVHALVRSLSEEFLNNSLDCRDTCRTTYKENLADV